MTENTGKFFKVPKIRKEFKDGLREVDITSRDAKEINHILQRSYIEGGYKPLWELKTAHYVQNKELEDRYRQKKTEMKDEGRNARDLAEQYSFLLFRDKSMVPNVAKSGLKCRSLPFNALGNSKFGLYLCRNADIQLRLAEHWEIDTCVMIVFKITPGKCKVLISGADGGEGMEPTPNYDCHVAQYQPRSCDPIHLQLARSQIYLYEYTEDCEPSDQPRQCLPYAVLTYQKSQNKSQAAQSQSDSYSKRPAPVTDRSRTDPSDGDAYSRAEAVNLGDPRLRRKEPKVQNTSTSFNPKDPRLAYIQQQGGDMGLCVPRLTSGPPPSTPGPAPPNPGPTPSNPGSVWSREPRVHPNDYFYNPSFGPQFENSGQDFFSQQQQFQPVPGQRPYVHQINQIPPPVVPSFDNRLQRPPNQDPRLRDPRLQRSDTDNRKIVTKKLSLNDYKQKVGIQPVLMSEKSLEESNEEIEDDDDDEMYDPSFPSMDTDEPETAQSNSDKINTRRGSEEAVENPDDMVKALNDLSDPDDASQSPKRIADEVEEEDPVLAAAMRMLVEHSGDVSLFTEALRKLQESAEEIGDALHDPAFLVKAIAENVQSLTKSKEAEKIRAQTSENYENHENKLPNVSESKISQTHSNKMELDPTTPPQKYENTVLNAESPLAKAMKNTLDELHKAEQVPAPKPPSSKIFHGEMLSYTTGNLNNDTNRSDAIDLGSIPMPVDKQQIPNAGTNMTGVEITNLPLDDIPLPGSEQVIIGMAEQKPSDDRMKTYKPRIKFNLRKANTIGVPDSFRENEAEKDSEEAQDKDERMNSKSINVDENDHFKLEKKEVKVVELDKDYRIQEKDRYLGLPIVVPSSSKDPFEISEIGINAPKNSDREILLMEDKDDRRQSSQAEILDKDDRLRPIHPGSFVAEFQDKDERQKLLISSLENGDKKKTGMPKSIHMFDTDERILNPDLQNMHDPSLLDKDERRSHSRSQSPTTVHPVFMDMDERMVEQPGEEQREDDRIRSRSVSPLSPPQEPSIAEVRIIPLHNLDDSQSSNDSGLFDAYSLGNDTAKKEKVIIRCDDAEEKVKSQAENEFGDVDWRLAAEAAEMGDVDLRATKSSSSQGEGDIDLRASGSDPRMSVSDPIISGSDTRISVSDPVISGSDPRTSGSDSFSQPSSENMGPQNPSSYMNNTDYRPYLNTSNVQPMVDPHPDAIRPADSYSTSRPNLEAYTTYKGPIASYSTSTGFGGEYRTSGFQGRSYGDQYSYSTGGKSTDAYWTGGNGPALEQYSSFNTNTNQTGPPAAGGLRNVINNLDFSSLKNILAIVQSPGLQGAPQNVSPNKQPASFMQENTPPTLQQVDDHRSQPEQTKTESDEETENQPAFCTGLSFLKSKQPKIDKTRSKYTGMARTNADGTQAVLRSSSGADVPALSGFQHGHERKLSTGDRQETISGWSDVDKNHPEGGALTLPGFDPPNRGEEITSGIIPGFASAHSGGIPGLGMIDQCETEGSGKPFTFSEDIPDRDISSSWFEDSSGKDTKKSDKSDSKSSDKSDGKSKSPRKKSKRNKAESSVSEFAESWQNAILESMEQSALTVKSDDSICMEEETASAEPESKSLISEGSKTNEGIKRSLDEGKDDTEKVCKRIKADPDSDEEGDGLVIDLDMSHTAKEVEKQEALGESAIMIKDAADDDEDEDKLKIVESVTDTDGRGTPVLDEKGEEEEVKVEKVQEEDTVTVPSTNIELKSFMEKKRKNIVIKLKGETKKVNPKTGKAYTENAVGSAIEVLGQTKKGAVKHSNIGQQIHPIHGIVSLGNRPNCTLQGSSISTLINRNPVPKPNNPMPVGVNFNQQSLPLKKYTHPFTGQTVAYPAQPGSQSQLSPPAVINHYQGTGYHLGSPPVQSLPIVGQQYGMTIPTLGSQSSQSFQRTVSDNNQFATGDEQAMRVVTLKSEKNYELSQSNANKYIKTEVDLSSRIADSNTRKRSVTEKPELGSDVKKIKTEPTASSDHRVVKVLTDHSQNVNEPSTSGTNNPQSTDGKNTGDDSELEDGEISDDDDTEIIPKHSSCQDNRNQGHGQWSESRGYDRRYYPPYEHPEYSSRDFPHHRNGPPLDDRPHRAASQWSDLLHHPKHTSKFSDEASSVLSKSAETFSKAKQKLQARNQVKTLGDWLKVELEIDNIEPLQKVIPYSLNTDLSTIQKQRRRKIRFKVKNTIEQEGFKQLKFTSNTSEPEEHESIEEDMTYKPEVSRDQIEGELNMVRDLMGAISAPPPVRMNMPIVFQGKPLIPGSYIEAVFMAALTLIESEMITLLGRSNFYGYPHRRVPKDLLLESEFSGFRSCVGDIFLVLMTPISMKAQQKLYQFKKDLVKLYEKKEKANKPDLVEQEIKSMLIQRQSLLRSFTGYLNKKRIAKLQELADKFTMVFEFFKSQDPPLPQSALKFIWTSLADIRQHLLIAKQYLAMEETKLEVTHPMS